ncbi:major facilitator superfamily domain-containing protein [Mycena albidolilacea]|uniref:Major facilitator superfamily domain-containing protein n=1 Tax=Mycena albidolilacea TaxID=1033008 RepID=A0AAD7AIP8_9AGAR|nr:major facilitator superfamily domain-containing protein [Mycena albidolilacea]
MPPRRSFGPDESAIDDSPETPEQNRVRSFIGRLSFGNFSQRRPSFASRLRNSGEDGGAEPGTPRAERPPIPTMMQSSGETYATPLPILSMVVLSITMLGEFLSANVSTPFVLFMVKGFGEFTDDADIAFWTGILVSTFFLTQFLTAILWATVADKHGRRFVLVVSLLGSAVTCVVFGTCTTLEEAICVRLLQGVFAGAVGVARGSVSFVTDPTNEGRAYAILGFCWGMGGVAGAIVGGSFERPAVKWPGLFEDTIFVNYPYLLPCAVAASVTLIGSILGCFLGPDGGPREGSIRLIEKPDHDAHPPIPEEESRPPTPVFDEDERATVAGTIRKKFSGYFAKRVPDAPSPNASPSPHQPVRLDRTRTFSRTSRANGSAYGYTGSYRNRLASNATTTNLSARRGSMASSVRRRRNSNVDGHRPSTTGDLNFAQRLLMANENAVTNIADLWVAAAMNVDNEDPFESDTEMGSDGERDSADVFGDEDFDDNDLLTPSPGNRASRAPSTASPNFQASSRRPSSGIPTRPLRIGSPRRPIRQPSFSQPLDGTPTSRRFSTGVPTIFAHPGVKTPPAVLDAQQLLMRSEAETDGLEPILESRRTSLHDPQSDIEAALEPPPPSLFSQLPLLVIIQYGLLALHTTSHDQVFLSYLVTDYDAGGLNLDAGNFAQLIALMCLAQIAYQFYLYPNIGPPRGRFSHLAMFRIGSVLFVPAYLVVTLLRPFASASADGNLALMSALAISTALRYCGTTFAYTSVSILLNYMTPPSAVGLANGIAQSIVSLARCFGPVIGGYLWSISVQDNPGGYPLGFIICAGVCAFSVLHSFMIR